MSDSWKQVDEDAECPLPDIFWHIEYISGTYDRISVAEAEKVKTAMRTGVPYVEVETLAGGTMVARTEHIIFIGENSAEMRRIDRSFGRWLTLEGKKDPYLKSVTEDE